MIEARESLHLVLPLPSPNLSPNARCGRRTKARSIAKYREAGFIIGLGAKNRSAWKGPWASAEMRYRFFYRDSRRRDPDNLLASMKAAIDGIVDAGILSDDSGLKHHPVEFGSGPQESPRGSHHYRGEYITVI